MEKIVGLNVSFPCHDRHVVRRLNDEAAFYNSAVLLRSRVNSRGLERFEQIRRGNNNVDSVVSSA